MKLEPPLQALFKEFSKKKKKKSGACEELGGRALLAGKCLRLLGLAACPVEGTRCGLLSRGVRVGGPRLFVERPLFCSLGLGRRGVLVRVCVCV